jgi:hypothetical protein
MVAPMTSAPVAEGFAGLFDGAAAAGVGAANIMVAALSGGFAAGGAEGLFGGGATLDCEGSGALASSSDAAAGRVTLKVLPHFPQRMVRPAEPTRPSSMR